MRDTSGCNSILVTFPFLYNIDLGLINIIREKYSNPFYMKKELLSQDNDFFKLLLLTEDIDNILKYIMTEEKRHMADSLYNRFKNERYNEIVANSPRLDTCDVIENFISIGEGTINVNVLCERKEEVPYVEEISSSINIINSDYSNLDIEPYGSIYVYSANELLKFNPDKLKGKNLYIAKIRRNFEDDNYENIKGPVIAEFGDCSRFNIIDPYVNIIFPLG